MTQRTQSQRKFLFPTYIVQFQKHIFAKKSVALCTKKCKYTQKMIEMIFSLHKICNIYSTL
jgi:hypothetical protein